MQRREVIVALCVLLWVSGCSGLSWRWEEGVSGLKTFLRNGKLYVCGTFNQTADLDPTSGVNYQTGDSFGDVFVSRISLFTEIVEWTGYISGRSTQGCKAIYVNNAATRIYIIGTTNFYPLDVDPNASTFLSTTNGASFISVLNNTGTPSFLYGGQVNGGYEGVIETLEATYWSITTTAGFGFLNNGGAQVTRTVAGKTEVMIQRTTFSGVHTWIYNFGTAWNEVSYSNHALSSDGFNLYFQFAGAGGNFNPGGIANVKSVCNHTLFQFSWTNSATLRWFKQLNGCYDPFISRFQMNSAMDDQNQLYLAANFRGVGLTSADVNVSYSGGTHFDIVLMKRNYTGTFQWARTIQGAGNQFHTAFAVRRTCGIVMVGQFNGMNIDFSNGQDPSYGKRSSTTQACFIVKWDVNGVFQWVKIMSPDSGSCEMYYVSWYAETCKVIVQGQIVGTAYFDGDFGCIPFLAPTQRSFILALESYGDPAYCESFYTPTLSQSQIPS